MDYDMNLNMRAELMMIGSSASSEPGCMRGYPYNGRPVEEITYSGSVCCGVNLLKT